MDSIKDNSRQRKLIAGLGVAIAILIIKLFTIQIIDDKYKKNTCEYNAIKEHEKGHVKIYQEELKYYGGMLINTIKNKIFDNSDLLNDKSKLEIESNLNNIFNSQEILVLKDKLQQVLISKNQEYDSSEEYLRVNKLCNNW